MKWSEENAGGYVCKKKSKHSKTRAVYDHLVYQGKTSAALDIYKDS